MTVQVATAPRPPRIAHRLKYKVEHQVGGPARAKVILLFACVLALESADVASVGAAAPELRHSLHITNAQLGLLAAVSTLVGAVLTIPAGALTDRVRRVNLLVAAVALWGAAMAAGAAAQGYGWLLVSRLALGAIAGAAGPLIASLTGDLFPAAERAKIYGYILSGELLGAGVGFVVSGSVAGALSWRWAFAVLVVPAAALALVIWRALPEPARGGQSRLRPGADHIPDEHEAAHRSNGAASAEAGPPRSDGIARKTVLSRKVRPISAHILREDPSRLPLRRAIWYVLQIRTNRWLIAASAVGYFFFAGLRTFGLVFVRGHFALSQATATGVLFISGLGSLAGVLIAGRLADRLIRKGILNARVLVGAIAFLAAALILVPSMLVGSALVAIPLLFLAAAALGAPNPPLDAARLDIVPAQLWGRAEGVRTLLRQTAQAGAPLAFGLLADALGGSHATSTGQAISASTTRSLQYAFLIMLIPLALNGLVLLGARNSYAPDVSTAIASESARERSA